MIIQRNLIQQNLNQFDNYLFSVITQTGLF